MVSTKRVVVILANPDSRSDHRAGVVSDLCASFCKRAIGNGFTVDIIDLYKDKFNPVAIPGNKDTQTLEYQIRIKKADYIAVFHPIWWGTMPAILKGFCDKVFEPGFAYQHIHGTTRGMLHSKKAFVVAVSDSPEWEVKFMYANIIKVMWQRVIFDPCGIKTTFHLYSDVRKASKTTLSQWHTKVYHMADSIAEMKFMREMA
jgi:NAD(P)H dehydrogenase (quinone)